MGARNAFPPPGLVALIAASHLAPFGHGEQTLVDTQVRNTWELSANQFRLENAAFSAFVKDEIAEACRVPLGIHASVAFEAKLYKLLLYETGGKFDQHQDSEKESGMFGTLVVVLPGRFEGGELVVHHPSPPATRSQATASTNSKETPNAYEFDAAAMDPFALKYAAFYGDCPHEVKPVTKGYRLCLTYNLINVANSTTAAVVADPHFGSNHVLYKTLQSALDEYFCVDEAEKKKRQRLDTNGAEAAVGFDVTNPDTHRQSKLVYVTTHKYTDVNLSFRNLENRDAAVVSSLARYCDASDGAFSLYSCKIKYLFRWRGDEGTMYRSDEDSADNEEYGDANSEYIDRCLDLLLPRIRYKKGQEVSVDASGKLTSFVEGDLKTDVAPCGVFERKGIQFDGQNSSAYTGNEGASSDRWYGSAALVIAPLQLDAEWMVQCKKSRVLLEKWFALVDSKPVHARAIALVFRRYVYDWSTTSALGLRSLETAAKLDDVDAMYAVLSAFKRLGFQPNIRELLTGFGTERLAKIVKALARHWRVNRQFGERNAFNWIASTLDGVTDTRTIALVLDAVNLIPQVDCMEAEDVALRENETTPEEFARVLPLIALESENNVKGMLDACRLRSLVLVGAPANQLLFATTQNEPAHGAVVLACANHAPDLLTRNLPAIRNLSYTWRFGCPPHYNCACQAVRTFLSSQEEVTTFDKTNEGHLTRQLQAANLLGRVMMEPSTDDAESTVVLKKMYESPLFKKAQEVMVNLQQMTHELVRVAVLSGSRATSIE